MKLYMECTQHFQDKNNGGSIFFPLKVAPFKMCFPQHCNVLFCYKNGLYRYKYTKILSVYLRIGMQIFNLLG